MTEYEIIFSKRKTLSLQVTHDGVILVRAPIGTGKDYIEDFVRDHKAWIEKATARGLAREILPGKVQYFASLIGVTPGRITVTGARTSFGTCSGKNNLSFSFYLMRFPDEAVDYVVVHELAHLKEMNHSKRFYDVVASVMPDYKRRRRYLK